VAADAPRAPQGGFAPPQANSFAALGADAPTRIARPVGAQQVSKRKTIERGVGGLFMGEASPVESSLRPVFGAQADDAQAGGELRRRRAGRMARYEGMTPEPAPAMDMPPSQRAVMARPAMPPEGRERPAPTFDPFEAGDSETIPPELPAREPEPDADRLPRRPAVPGERYTGARTALPQRGEPSRQRPPTDSGLAPESAPPAPQGQRPARADEEGRPMPQRPVRYDEQGRPMPPQARPQGALGQPPQGQRPVRYDEQGRPMPPQARPQGAPGQPPQGQRPVRYDEQGRPMPMQQRPQPRPPQDDAARGPHTDPRRRMRMEEEPEEAGRFDPRRGFPTAPPRASVERPAYAFEDEPEEERPRRGGALIPLLVVLLLLGGILAGIVLPDWDGMGGGLGTAMGKIKGAVVGVMDSLKGLIMPDAAGVKSLSVNPTAATAPVELVFNVQASTSVSDIRILDQNGDELLRKTLTDSDMLGGAVTKNKNGNIWTLRYAVDSLYTGVFTAQALKPDGTWEEGVTLGEPVNISPPVMVEPPVQGFEIDIQTGETPVTVSFAVITSTDVNAVQIVDDYGTVVAEALLSDIGDQVVEDGTTRTWTLRATVSDPYTGGYYAGYESGSDQTFTQSDYSLDVALSAAGEAVPTDAVAEETPASDYTLPAIETPTQSVEPAQTPTPVVTATPAPKAEATAEPTPLPLLNAAADEAASPAALKLDTKAYEELKLKETYERKEKIVVTEPHQYAVWDQSGILTFRGDSFRQNAAYGTVAITRKALTELWRVPMEGSIKAKSATLTGVGWPGQPLIVKWPTQLRAIMGLTDEAKNKQALKEVMVGGQNGKLYFLDLVTGQATREAISVDWPLNGALSLQTNASPMLAVGQHIGVLAKKTVDNGLHLYNLINNKELTLLKGKEKLMRSNYSGVSGAPVFDKNTGALVFGGENGILYTMEPNDDFDHVLATLKLAPAVQRYTWLAGKQKTKSTNIDGAVAMYGGYAYFGDQTGIVQCVDVNTLTPVWAVNTGDNVDATIALDMENATTVALYTANTILGQGRSGVCTIRRLDALTGRQAWAYTVPGLTYTTEAEVGVYASPVVGAGRASGLVFFTATNGLKNGTLYALGKADGQLKWSLPLTSPTLSSPVAVYGDAGDAWLVQAAGDGTLSLIDALTGQVATTLKLEGGVECSPAVYRDVLVIATTGQNASIYGIKLE
jgi:outer membrane protein assembly factor BamB